jgi:hypothetical protein
MELSYCTLPESGLQGVQGFQEFRNLEIIGCDLSERDVRLLGNAGLDVVTIRDVAIKPEWLLNTPELKALKQLTLEAARFNAEARSRIGAELPNTAFE